MKFFKSKEERAACEAEIERKDMRYAERIEALNAQERAERFAEWKRTCTRCEATWYAPVHPEAYSKAIGAAAAFAVCGVVGVIATHSKRAAEENQLAALDR